MSMGESAINIRDLRFSYDRKRNAVDGIALDVRRGEIFGFLGRNGAGKTTTIKILTTLLTSYTGSASVLGIEAKRGGKGLRRRIGVVLQDDSFDFTTVEKALDIYGTMWGVKRSLRREKIEELLNFFELEEVRKKRLWDLSGGQRRRVQVAREFMHDMELLFLDEPTVGLDTLTRRKILDMVRSRANEGLTIFFTTHNLEEADYVCSRIAIIDRGRIVANDSVSMLKKQYAGLKTVEVSFSEGREEVMKVLGSLECASIEAGNDAHTYRITGADMDSTIRELMEKGVSRGLHLTWLNMHPVTLEEVFLKAVSAEG